MHAGLRIWEIWTPELLRPAHVEAARNRRSASHQVAHNALPIHGEWVTLNVPLWGRKYALASDLEASPL